MRRKLAVIALLVAVFMSLSGAASASPIFATPRLEPPAPKTWKDCITGHC